MMRAFRAALASPKLAFTWLPAGSKRAVLSMVEVLRVVEDVEHLPAQLEAPPLPAEAEVLEEGQVPVVDARVLEGVAGGVAVLSAGRARHRGGIDPGTVRARAWGCGYRP